MKNLNFKTVNVFTTNDYAQFNFFEFNRKIDMNHVNKLSRSMKKRGFTGVLIVIRTAIVDGVEKLYILDGQHRFMASKQLGINFKFEVVDIKTELELAHYIADVNNSSKAWGTNQFLDVWSQMKINEYVKLQEVYKETKIQITPLVMAYTGTATMNDFRGGTMTFPDVDKSNQIIEQIMDLDVLPKKAFCRRAIIRIMRKENYNHEVIKPYILRQASQSSFSENEKDLEKELEHLLKISNKY